MIEYVSGDEAEIGTVVEVQATPETGYEIQDLSVNGETILDSYSFLVEEAIEYTISAQFRQIVTEAQSGSIHFSGIGNNAFDLTLSNLVLENVDVSSVSSTGLYRDGDLPTDCFRMATSSNAGSVTFRFPSDLTVQEVTLDYEPYHSDTPSVQVSIDGDSLTQGESDKTYSFGGQKTEMLKIDVPKKQRIILSGIDIQFVDVPVVPVPATISVEQEGPGNVSIAPSSDWMVGDEIVVTATPEEGYYLSNMTLNGDRGSYVSNGTYSFEIEQETNVLNVTFRERGTSSDDYSYLYANEVFFPDRGNQSVDIDQYYEPIRGLSGLALKEGLHDIIDDHEAFSYDSANDSLPVIDVDPFDSSKVRFIYESEPRSNRESFNKEHTWAKSHGDFGERKPMGSDLHNLRMCFNNLNSTRGNHDFKTVAHSTETSILGYDWARDDMEGNYVGGGGFEPQDEWKGDVARIIFYMATRYDGGSGEVDLEVSGDIDTSRYYDFTSGADGLHGNFGDLYEWATSGIDPVDDYEVHRNNLCDQLYQHNRNPFIDHPEFLIMIYDKAYDGPGALN